MLPSRTTHSYAPCTASRRLTLNRERDLSVRRLTRQSGNSLHKAAHVQRVKQRLGFNLPIVGAHPRLHFYKTPLWPSARCRELPQTGDKSEAGLRAVRSFNKRCGFKIWGFWIELKVRGCSRRFFKFKWYLTTRRITRKQMSAGRTIWWTDVFYGAVWLMSHATSTLTNVVTGVYVLGLILYRGPVFAPPKMWFWAVAQERRSETARYKIQSKVHL